MRLLDPLRETVLTGTISKARKTRLPKCAVPTKPRPMEFVGHLDVPFEEFTPEEVEEINKLATKLPRKAGWIRTIRENRNKLRALSEKCQRLTEGAMEWTAGLIDQTKHLALLRDMARHTVRKDFTKVWRGLSFSTRKELQQFKQGFFGQDWYIFDRIQGFTTNSEVANRFATERKFGAKITLKAPNGVTGFDVAPYSHHNHEAEILISDKIRYKINSVSEKKSMLYIELEDVTASKRLSKADKVLTLDLELWPFLSETRNERVWKKRAKYLREKLGYTEDEIRRDRRAIIRAMAATKKG